MQAHEGLKTPTVVSVVTGSQGEGAPKSTGSQKTLVEIKDLTAERPGHEEGRETRRGPLRTCRKNRGDRRSDTRK